MSKKNKKAEIVVEAQAVETPIVETPVAVIVETPAPEAKPDILRKSAVTNPVAKTWLACDSAAVTHLAMGGEKPRRKDIVNALIAHGVAYYTARTQYQAWSKATDNGRLALAAMDPKDLPRSVRDALATQS